MPYGTYTSSLSSPCGERQAFAYQPGSLPGVYNPCSRTDMDSSSWDRLPAYMLSAVIRNQCGYPAMQLTSQPAHQGLARPGPLVLEANSLKNPTLTADRGRPVSRRSEPSSRSVLTDEQTDPWDLLQPQDTLSRHRGSEPRRRYELLGATTLLSPG